MIVAEIIKETQRGCPDCQKVGDDIEPEPLYECSSCGDTFSKSNSADGESHRCPQCNKFGAKVSDEGCPECNVELEDMDTYIYKDETYTDEDDLIQAIKDNNEALPEFLQEIDMKHQEERQKAEAERKQGEMKQIITQRQNKEFRTVEEVEEAFKAFLNAVQSPLLKLVQQKDSEFVDATRQYVEKDEDENIRWHLSFEVTWNTNDKYVSNTSIMNKTEQFWVDVKEAGMKYIGMKPSLNSGGSCGWFIN